MHNDVTVVFDDNLILVDGVRYDVGEIHVLQGHENAHAIQWHNGSGYIEFKDDINQSLFGDELYNTEVKPYADIWEEAKTKADNKKIEEETTANSLEAVRSSKLSELNLLFYNVCRTATIRSSLRFIADADEVAARNVTGLVTTTPLDGDCLFCDANNLFHTISYQDLLILQREIILNGQSLYTQKWDYRNQINNAQNVDEIKEIKFDFYMQAFQ